MTISTYISILKTKIESVVFKKKCLLIFDSKICENEKFQEIVRQHFASFFKEETLRNQHPILYLKRVKVEPLGEIEKRRGKLISPEKLKKICAINQN